MVIRHLNDALGKRAEAENFVFEEKREEGKTAAMPPLINALEAIVESLELRGEEGCGDEK